MSQEFIVAEVSKNWPEDSRTPPETQGMTVAALFEQVIETNRGRGYVLHDFSLHRLLTGQCEINETIIAVFRRAS